MNRLAPDHQPALFPGAILRRDWPFGDLEPWSFDLLCADPPWRFENYSVKGQAKGPEPHYPTMALDDIKALPVGELAARDSLLWLWATAPMLPQALEVMDAWGFAYTTCSAWHKTTEHGKTAFGTGYVFRSAMELVLVGKRGEPHTTRSVRNIIVGKAREHSRKPEEAFEAAERLMPNARRVELFSRQSRPGWSAWGFETGKFDTEGAAA